MSSSSLGRISVFLSQKTGLSRRYIEKLIENRCVFREGKVVESFALPREELKGSWTLYDGSKTYTIKEEEKDLEPKLWIYHKPPKELVTWKDPQGRPTIFETVRQHLRGPLWSVGRLDYESTGLLLLTNKTALAHFLEKSDVERSYDVDLWGCSLDKAKEWLEIFGSKNPREREKKYAFLSPQLIWETVMKRLEKGLVVDGISYKPCSIKIKHFCPYEEIMSLNITLIEGKNREIRRMLGSIGLHVDRLHRLSYGPFFLKNLPKKNIQEQKIPQNLLDSIDTESTS